MEYVRVNPDRNLLERTSTADTLEVVFCGKYEICMLAGMEEDKLICYAVFSHIPGSSKEVYLEHLFTIRGRREEGNVSALLAYSENYFAERGMTAILSRFFLKPEFAVEFNEFMVARGFLPLCLTGRILHYNLADMLGAGTIQTMIKARKKLPPILTIKKVGEQQINALLARHKETGFTFVKEEADEKYSRFYMDGDVINGAIIASRPSEDTLYISALYMDRFAEKKNIFLSLFSECVAPVCKDLSENDIKVIVVLNNETVYNGLMEVFNPPEEEYLILEHMKQLKGVNNGNI